MIFTRPQWRSWLVRGAFIIAGYGAVLARTSGSACTGRPRRLLALGVARRAARRSSTAVYTAYLFAQAKARDLWQSPLLPPHLLVQALLAGAAALLPLAAALDAAALRAARLGRSAPPSRLHLLLVLGEITLPHVDRARAARGAGR